MQNKQTSWGRLESNGELTYRSDELAAYGLSKGTYDEWHELSERRKGLQRGKRLRDSDGSAGRAGWARPAVGGFAR